MRWTIGKRIFAALTITSLVIVGLNAASTRWSFQRGFVEYLGQQEAERLSAVVDGLAEIYRRDASWEGLKNEHRLWDELFRDKNEYSRPPPRHSPAGDRHLPRRGGLPPNDPLDLRARVALLDATGAIVKGRDFLGEQARRVEVSLDGELVGELLVLPQTELTEQVDVNFANEQTRSIIYTSILVLIFAAVIAALIAKQLVRPISALTAGTRALTAGTFEKRITVARDDELGDLARDFNLLAETLQANQTSRRQWVSDIAHELRTPLAILSGELQAIEDGVRNFDEGTRSSLQAEVDRLGRLVADLHELTLSDEGGLRYDQEIVDVAAIIKQTLDSSQIRFDDAELSLQLDVGEEQLLVAGDSARLEQLFMNLIENSIRYTDSPGAIEVRISASDETITIVFEDSLPGVSVSEAHRLFDRLYRVDDSRNRTMGGSGLGLSICESIVGAHGGEITADQSNLGGVAIQIKLPRVAASASKP
jgi:two-component system sensor histidine kinase BaeS